VKWPRLSLERKRGLAGYAFIAPWIVGFVALLAVPLLQSVAFSLSDLHVTGGGYYLERAGWNNYRYILPGHPLFLRTLAESVLDMIANVPLILVFSVFAASLVKKQFRGRSLARILFFLPVIISSGVVLKLQAQDWMQELVLRSPDAIDSGMRLQSAALREYLLQSGLNKQFVLYLTGAVTRIHDIISRSGVQILLALAGLQSLPESFFEAARMEGATQWEIFWKITFPSIASVLLVIAVYTIIDSFTSFDNATMEMVRVTAFGQSQYGQSAAMAWVYFVLIVALVAIMFASTARKIFYQE